MTEFEGFEKAYGSETVEVSFYRLQADGRPVAQVTPSIVSVEFLDPTQELVKVWPLRRRPAPRYPPRKKPKAEQGPTDDLPALEDQGGEFPDEEEPDDDGDIMEDEPGKMEDIQADVEGLCDFAFGIASKRDAPAQPDPPAQAEQQAASSSSSAPAPSPEPPTAADERSGSQEEGGQAAKPRRGADVTFHVPGGSISYYPSKQAFEAVCDHPSHLRCVATRTCKAKGRAADGLPKGGRPVGFLVAWLGRGEHLATKEAHWAEFDIPLEERTQARANVSQTPAGHLLLSKERAPVAGESAEPLSLDGYL